MLERHYKQNGDRAPRKLLGRFHENEVPHDYFDYKEFEADQTLSSDNKKDEKPQFPTKLLLDHQAKNYKRMVDTLAKERLRIKNLQKKISILANELENVQTDTVGDDILEEEVHEKNVDEDVEDILDEKQNVLSVSKENTDLNNENIQKLKIAIEKANKQLHTRNFQNRFVFPKNRTIKKISLPDGMNHDDDTDEKESRTRNVTVYEKLLNWECPFDYSLRKKQVLIHQSRVP